ncbi:hypothetical protein FI667_g1153, partial [Globisporangium splendens]
MVTRGALCNEQEEADVGVAAVLSCYRGLRSQTTNADKDNGELFEEAVAIIQKKKFEQQKAYVQDQVSQQVRISKDLCALRVVVDSLQTAFDAILKLPRGSEKSTPTISLSGFERIDDARSDKARQNADVTLGSLLGYSLSVETSSIPNAGEGVKVNGQVPIGSLVVQYPVFLLRTGHVPVTKLERVGDLLWFTLAGVVPWHRPQYLQEISNNPYARARFDSVVIDAKRESSTPRNPLAVAHKINHPPAGSKPNVIPFSFDFPPEEPFTQAEYQQLIPNSFVEMPSRWSMFGKRALVHGLAFIATADIEDEELFLNYRYNPHNPLPEWYTPVDLESDQEMWK